MDPAITAAIITGVLGLVGILVKIWFDKRSTRSDSTGDVKSGGNEALTTTLPEEQSLWPDEHNLDALKQRLSRVSKKNREILYYLVEAGPDGMYIDDLAKATGIPEEEVVERG